MSGFAALMSGGSTNSTTPTQLAGYRIQTSIFGGGIPILGGTNRISGNTIWMGNWKANPVQNGGKAGGKGSGGGKGGGQFQYSSSFILALTQGPALALFSVWQDKSQVTDPQLLPNAFGTGARGATPWGYLISNFPSQALGYSEISIACFENQNLGTGGTISNYSFEIAGSQLFGGVVTGVSGSKLLITNCPLRNNSQVQVILGPGATTPTGISPVTSTGATQYYWTVNADAAGTQLALTQGGSAVSITSAGTGVVFVGWVDSLISDFINFVLTDFNGAHFPATSIGDLTEIHTYCLANGLAISPVIDSQQTFQSYLQEYLLISNSEAFESEGLIKFRTYGDKAVTGNGVTFTPDLTPIFQFDNDAFISGHGQNPITFTLEAAQDANNQLSFEWTNRGRQYNLETITDSDQNAVDLYGKNIGSPQTIHSCCLATVAQQVLNVQLKRSVYMLRKAQFKIGAQYSILEPMDIVLIPEQYPSTATVGLRVLQISEDENGNFDIEGEILPFPILNPVLHPKQASGGYTPGYEADPGITIAPIFLELPPQMVNSQLTTQLWLSMSLGGGPQWGGAGVYVSKTGISGPYVFLGQQTAPSIMGFLTADYAYSSIDPDTVNLLQVNLQPSLGELDPGNSSVKSADAGQTVVIIDQELVGYAYTKLTGANQYAFENSSNIKYNRRGMFGTYEALHKSGASVSVVGDGNQFLVQYSATDLGSTWWFKFTSFNKAGQVVQDLADATAYPWYLTAPFVRGPLTYKPFGTAYAFAPSEFSMSVKQSPQINLGQTIQISGIRELNGFSTQLVAPTIDPVANVIANPSNNLPVGEYIAQVFLIDSGGFYSPGSNLTEFTITTPTSEVLFNLSNTQSAPHWDLFIGVDIDSLYSQGLLVGTPPSAVVIDDIQLNGPGPPDGQAVSYSGTARKCSHAGICDTTVNSSNATLHRMTVEIPSAAVVNFFAGRYILNVGNLTTPGADDSFCYLISASDTNVPCNLTVNNPTGSIAAANSLMVICFSITAVTLTTTTDANVVSPYAPGGLTANTEIGSRLKLLYDPTGAGIVGDEVTIISNTSTTWTHSPWLKLPGIGSVFVEVEAGYSNAITVAETTAATFSNYTLNSQLLFNMPATFVQGNVALVEVLALNGEGVPSLQHGDTLRLIYVVPNAVSSGNPGYYTITPGADGNILIDLANGLKQRFTLVAPVATTAVAVIIDIPDVSITVTDNSPFASFSLPHYFNVTGETMLVTAKSGTGNVVWAVTRGLNNTSPLTHQVSDSIVSVPLVFIPIFTGGTISNGTDLTIYEDQSTGFGNQAIFVQGTGGFTQDVTYFAIAPDANTRTTFLLGFQDSAWGLEADPRTKGSIT